MTLLTVKNLTKKFKEKTAVGKVSFSFEAGKCVALIGPNGAGKTTIIRTLAGLLKPTSGTIEFKQMKPNQDIRAMIGYLPQYPMFYSWMTGKEFLIYSGELSFLPKSQAAERAEELLKVVGIADAKNKRIGTYSGGMKQRLGIAQAIIHHPKLLLLDEPVSSLDPLGRREVLELIEQLKLDMTILFSTHILADADEVSDELLLLHKGKIVEAGSMKELRHKHQADIIELKFEHAQEKYLPIINQLPTVTNTTFVKESIFIEVTHIDQARRELFSLAVTESWPLLNFTVKEATLEDMFLKVVK